MEGSRKQAAVNVCLVTDEAVDGYFLQTTTASSLSCLRANGPPVKAERIPTLTAGIIKRGLPYEETGLLPALETGNPLFESDVVLVPLCRDGHWTLTFICVEHVDRGPDEEPEDEPGKVRLIFVYHDPLVFDSYAPGVTEEMVRTLATIKAATLNGLDEAALQRIAGFSYMALSHSHGHHQTDGISCGLMILATARCFLENRPLNATMEKIRERGPVFGYEVLHGFLLPLWHSDRETGAPTMMALMLHKSHVDAIRAARRDPVTGKYAGPPEPQSPPQAS